MDEPAESSESADSLAEALADPRDDDERATRIHYLVDEAYPPDPAVRQRQHPDDARRATRTLVAYLDDVAFDDHWRQISEAARLESAYAHDTSALRWVSADPAELIVDPSDFATIEPADRSGVDMLAGFGDIEYTEALREAWSERRGELVRALVADDGASRRGTRVEAPTDRRPASA